MDNTSVSSRNSASEISAILDPEEPTPSERLKSNDLPRPKAIARICFRFIETEEDIEDVEYLLSFLAEKRGSTVSIANTEASLAQCDPKPKEGPLLEKRESPGHDSQLLQYTNRIANLARRTKVKRESSAYHPLFFVKVGQASRP